MRLSPNEMAWCLKTTGFAAADIITGVAVGIAESGGETDVIGSATSGTTNNRDHGVWQISNRWHSPKLQATPNWRDPLVNARLAKLVFDETVRAGKVGWSAWAVYSSGSYEQFVEAAKIGAQHPFRPVYLPERIEELMQRISSLAVDLGTLDGEILTAIKNLKIIRTEELTFE